MKVIDLLNKIANNEEVPLRIKYDDEIYIYNFEIKDYEFIDRCGWLMDISRGNGNEFLNDEIEIIEEKPKKEFCKSGFAIKNICRECQNKKQKEKLNASKNWNELKKWLEEIQQEEFNINGFTGVCTEIRINCILDKMQELEGNDENNK